MAKKKKNKHPQKNKVNRKTRKPAKKHKAKTAHIKQTEKQPDSLEELKNILIEDLHDPDEKKVETKSEIKTQKNKETKENHQKPSETDSTMLADVILAKQKKRRKIYFFSSVLGAACCLIATFVGLYFFDKAKAFDEEHISLQITGPEIVTVGQQAKYVIQYKNNGQVDIKNTKVTIQPPKGLKINQTLPETTNNSWELGTVKSGQQGEIKINGELIDNLKAEQKLLATIFFTPQNFNSEFSVEKNFYTSLEPIEIKMEIDQPQNVSSGEKVTIKTTLTHELENIIKKLKFKLVAPADFELLECDPKTDDDAEWLINNFVPGTEQEIKIQGKFPEGMTFNNNEERLQEFALQILYPNEEDDYFVQIEELINIKIVDQELATYLIVNGSTEDKYVQLEDNLLFTLTYKNKGENKYNDLQIKAVINTPVNDILNWQKIDDDEYGKIEKTDTGKTITWSKLQIPDLETIEANQEGSINFSLPLKSLEEMQGLNLNNIGKDALEIYSSLILTDDSGEELPSIDSSKVMLHLNTDAKLKNKALYYYEDGTPIGNGPLPPQVGETTEYVIFWALDNNIHDIKDAQIIATLPDNVFWAENTQISTGEVNYNLDDKKITWSINKLPVSATKATLSFHVKLKPTTNDLGKLMLLLNNTIFTATDAVTNDQLTQTMSTLTSNLDEDENAVGQGVVIE